MKNPIDKFVADASSKLDFEKIRFAEEFLKSFDAVLAYKTVYGGEGMNDFLLRNAARRILNGKNVSQYINVRRTQEAHLLRVDTHRILMEYAHLAFSNAIDLFETDGDGRLRIKNLLDLTEAQKKSIKKVRVTERTTAKESIYDVTIETHDKVKALDVLKEHLKNLGDTGKLDIAQESDSPIEQMSDDDLRNLIDDEKEE